MIEELVALRAWRDQAAGLLKAIDGQVGIPTGSPGYLFETYQSLTDKGNKR